MDSIDYDRLRSDIMEYLQGAFFGGGYGAAFVELSDVENCSDQKLIQYANRYNFPLDNYIVDDYNRKRNR